MTERTYQANDVVEVRVVKIHTFGAIVRLPDRKFGLIHISQVADEFVDNINRYLKVGDTVTARVKRVAADGKIDLTLKKKRPPAGPAPAARKNKLFRIATLEEKLDAFLSRAGENKSEGLQTVT